MRQSYLLSESIFSCNCKLALCMDSLISKDDLRNFVWPSICMSEMCNAEKGALTVRQQGWEKVLHLMQICMHYVLVLHHSLSYPQITFLIQPKHRKNSHSTNMYRRKCPILLKETRHIRRPHQELVGKYHPLVANRGYLKPRYIQGQLRLLVHTLACSCLMDSVFSEHFQWERCRLSWHSERLFSDTLSDSVQDLSPCRQSWSSRLSWAQDDGSNEQNGVENKQILKQSIYLNRTVSAERCVRFTFDCTCVAQS